MDNVTTTTNARMERIQIVMIRATNASQIMHCKKGYIMNDNKNCVKKSFCEKHPDDSKCKYKNDNKNGNGKDSDDNNSHDGGGTRRR